MAQTVLITGGTGMIGNLLTGALVKKGYDVIILSRNNTNKKPTPNVRYALWNVEQQQIDIKAVQSADYIIHLAGAGVVDKRWSETYKKQIIESRTESSKLIYETLKNNANKIKAVVSASATGWYGKDAEPVKPFTETDTADSAFLGKVCRLWEASIEPVESLNKRLVKLRTGIALGKTGGALAEFKKPLRFGVAAILGNGKQIISWIHATDLCNMYIHAIENENIAGSYNAVAPNPVSNKTLMLQLAKAMKKKFYLPVYVPSFVLKIIMGESSVEVLKSFTVSCKKIQDAGFKFEFETIAEALEDLESK